MPKQYVYDFGELGAESLQLVGGKGAYLTEMVRLGLPVPLGFTITTEAAYKVYRGRYNEIHDEVMAAVRRLEAKTKKGFGSTDSPLLVSVRSGAAVSMPGIMESILNVGLNKDIVGANKSRFLNECYYKFLLGYGENVLGISYCNPRNSEHDYYFGGENIEERLKKILYRLGTRIPAPAEQQLSDSITAVFNSWNSRKAQEYRKAEGISNNAGTAVNVQAMVFGNKGKKSLTAAFFTRNPSTGEKKLFGSYIEQAQGDTLVQGGDSKPISKLGRRTLREFRKFADTLEDKLKDMQEIEVTVEEGTPYLLQTRAGKRTSRASVRVLLDLTKEGKITEEEMLLRLEPGSFERLEREEIAPGQKYKVIGKGTPVSPGIVCGYVAHNPNGVREISEEGLKPILVKKVLDTRDIAAINQAAGILTTESQENSVSHAIVVARGKNKPCVTGVKPAKWNDYLYLSDYRLAYQEPITLDAETGEIIMGHVKLQEAKSNRELNELLKLVRKFVPDDYLTLVQSPSQFNTIITSRGIIYKPNLSKEDAAALKRAVLGDKECIKAFQQKQYEEYSRALKAADGRFSPFFAGLTSLEDLTGLVGDKGRLEFRLFFLDKASTRKKSLDSGKEDKKKKELVVGSKFNYFGSEITMVGICSICHAIQGQYKDGKIHCIPKSELGIEDANTSKLYEPDYDFQARIQKAKAELASLEQLASKEVYQAQLKAVEEAAKETGRKDIQLVDISSGSNAIVVDGRAYEIIPVQKSAARILAKAREAVKNGKNS